MALVSGAFHTTHWTVVLTTADSNRLAAQRALASLCESYWMPLYAFARRRGNPPPEAEDLVQSFFARLLAGNHFQSADRERGRFRTFLLSAFCHFMANEWHRQQALKRGGGQTLISWDAQNAEERYAAEPLDGWTPETVFDRRWVESLLERVALDLSRQYAAQGKPDLFAALQPCLTGDDLAATYQQVGARLGMSEASVKVAVHRLRRAFGELLRLEIAHTVTSPAEIEDELRYLVTLFHS